jgi:hypothetical protein
VGRLGDYSDCLLCASSQYFLERRYPNIYPVARAGEYFDLYQDSFIRIEVDYGMRPLVYRCPSTGRKVQALVADGVIGPDTVLVPLDCPMCNRPHLVDLAECTPPDDDSENEN